MKLIIAKPSPYARKARVALIEKAIEFETIIENPWLPDTGIADVNPLGKIPALVLGDGRVIHDSKVIPPVGNNRSRRFFHLAAIRDGDA